MPFPTARSYLGIAKETVRNTAIAPVDSIPIKTFAPVDVIQFLDDKGLRGSEIELYGTVPGPQWSTFDFTGDVFPDTIGYLLAGVLCDYASSGAGPVIHTFGVLNSGDGQATKGYTIADYDALTATSGARYFPGATMDELQFKFNADGLLEYDAKYLAMPSSPVPTTAPVKTFGTLLPTPAYIATATIGGGVVTTVESGTLTLKRKVTAIHTVDGTPSPYRLFQGPVTASGTLTFVAEDETELLRYLNNTQPALDINYGAAINAATALQVHMSKVAYKTAKVERGKDYAEVVVTYDALGNTTDATASGGYGLVKATLTNAKAIATYA